MLAHRPQAALYGCAYHALYALTGEEHWLEHVADISPLRWLVRVQQSGQFLLTYYANHLVGAQTPAEVWQHLRDSAASSGASHLPLLVTIPSPRQDLNHMVAVALPIDAEHTVYVSDSALPEPLLYTLAEFLDSRYAQAVEIAAVGLAEMQHYPPQYGAEFLAAADAALYSM